MLSGFERNLSRETVLAYPLPEQDSPGFWRYPLAMEHPLASVQIAAFDSSLTLLLSEKKEIVDRFRAFFPLSADLAEENRSYQENNEKGGTPLC